MASRQHFSWILPLAVSFTLLAGCGSSSTTTSTPEQPIITKDANGTTITIPTKAPERIISLGATDSEILAALGLTAKVVGIDAFTNYPADIATKTKVTDDFGQANIEQIVALKPDLVLSFGGETAETDQKLEAVGITVVDLPAADLDGSLKEIRLVGQITHTESTANTLVDSMQQRIDAVTKKVQGATKSTVYMEVGYSPPPPYAFGGGSFGDSLITIAGGTNIFAANTSGGGYPQVSEESIIAANPQVVILTEDAAYGGDPTLVPSRPGWSVVDAVKNQRIYAVNPDIVQRPGPRIVDGLEQLAKDIHPELFK